MTKRIRKVTPKSQGVSRPDDSPGSPTARLVTSSIEHALVLQGVNLGVPRATLWTRVKRAIAKLRQTDEGAKQVERIQAALKEAGPLLTVAGAASGSQRSSAVSVARLFVLWADSHGITDPVALGRLMSAARWAVEEGELHAARRSGDPLTGDALESAIRLADRASTRAAFDLGQALEIHRESQKAKPVAFPLISYDYPAAPVVPLASSEPEDEPENDPEDGAELEPGPDPDEGDEPASPDENRLRAHTEEPEPPRPDGSAVLGVGRSRATAVVSFGPERGVGGPSQAARAEMLKHNLVFDPVSGRWVPAKEESKS